MGNRLVGYTRILKENDTKVNRFCGKGFSSVALLHNKSLGTVLFQKYWLRMYRVVVLQPGYSIIEEDDSMRANGTSTLVVSKNQHRISFRYWNVYSSAVFSSSLPNMAFSFSLLYIIVRSGRIW